jgi:tRNA threonylcarbamoyladenosine biosynthesis protein TsaE
MALGVGANPDEVSSPTFTIVQEYAGPSATLYHVDLYRLEGAEIDDLGLEDLVAGDGIVAIEWAERWKGRPDDAIEVTLEDIGDERRRIVLKTVEAGG